MIISKLNTINILSHRVIYVFALSALIGMLVWGCNSREESRPLYIPSAETNPSPDPTQPGSSTDTKTPSDPAQPGSSTDTKTPSDPAQPGSSTDAKTPSEPTQPDSPTKTEQPSPDSPQPTTPTDPAVTTGSLNKVQAEQIQRDLLEAHKNKMLSDYGAQWDNRVLKYNDGNLDYSMPFYYGKFDPKPADGYALIISMHGGGNAAPRTNDNQYENQKHLYDTEFTSLGLNGFIYLAPRAPANAWNLWHQSQVDQFFNIIIQLAVAKEGVNPNKVYIIGYSAGGDGVYQVAPRMAYRFAAASMMAGHPNETSPLGLRNLPFAIHVGDRDSGFNRNQRAAEWKTELENLHTKDPGGYVNQVVLHAGKGHWMDLAEAQYAFPFMFKYTRNAIPEKVVWLQDDVHHERFYWLGVSPELIWDRGEIVATYERAANTVHIEKSYTSKLKLYLNDAMLNLDNPVIVMYNGKEIFRGVVPRTSENIERTVDDFGDPYLVFPAIVELNLP